VCKKKRGNYLRRKENTVNNKQKPITKKQQLQDLRLRWNLQCKAAIANRASFILQKARADYLRVYGTDGVGLARYQAEVLEQDVGLGTHREVQRKERARAKKLILDTFKEFPRDTVTGMVAANMVDTIAGTDTSLTVDDLDAPANLLVMGRIASPRRKPKATGTTGIITDIAHPAFPFPFIPGVKWKSKAAAVVVLTTGLVAASLAPASAAGTNFYDLHRMKYSEPVATQQFTAPDGYTLTAERDGLYLPRLAWPVDRGSPVSDGFGWRTSPCAGCSSDHKGQDMNPGYGALIYAASTGRVTQVGWNNGLGWSVQIFDGYTWEFIYGHMIEGSSTVNVGDRVTVGQVIGHVGNTGSSTGAHLHFQINENGVPIDPMPILNRYSK